MSRDPQHGFSLVEVMAAMVISSIALMGTMGALELSSRQFASGAIGTRAVALVQDRLEAKRAARWHSLLEDDVDRDGLAEILMTDDGTGADSVAGDGIYSAMLEDRGVTLAWHVRFDGGRSISSAPLASIEAKASYVWSGSEKVVHLTTLRANPSYAGVR